MGIKIGTFLLLLWKRNGQDISSRAAMYSQEAEIHKYMILDKNDKLRDPLCKPLKNKGDFNHSLEALKAKKGIFVVSRRATSSATPARYFTCPQCYSFIWKEKMWHHHCITLQQKESEAAAPHRRKAFLYAALQELPRCFRASCWN